MKPKVVIVGAGLGGCFLAKGIYDDFDVSMIELSDTVPLLRDQLKDVARPAIIYPTIESGLGGTSKVWHNALMEIDDAVFEKRWPFSKEVINAYYEKAYLALSGVNKVQVLRFSEALKNKLIEMGLPKAIIKQSMFIPKARLNAWQASAIMGKVNLVHGEVVELKSDMMHKIIEIKVRQKDGKFINLNADYFVLAAGGLSSPLLLQKLSNELPLHSLKNAGFHYEDHPCAFVGEIVLDKPLYKLWNFPVKINSIRATVRLPFSFYLDGLSFSFQLRPAHHQKNSQPKRDVINILSDIRNFPFRLSNYLRLVKSLDDVCDILSFKFGLRIPTRAYSVLMIAEQPPSSYCAIWRNDDLTISRRWEFDDDYLYSANKAIEFLIENIRPVIKDCLIFPNWSENIFSSSHHSGTARMSTSSDSGVCDMNGKVHGFSNLFVCDASLIPASGFVNTGLTIAALSMRMADYFKYKLLSRD